MKISKKASLQLSINAIVVLVMAMVVLGLGLTFVRGLFGQGTEQLGNTIGNNQLKNPATPDNPLTLDSAVTVRRGNSDSVDLGFYNDDSSTLKVSLGRSVDPADDITPLLTHDVADIVGTGRISCINGDGVALLLRLTTPPAFVPPGEAIGFKAIVKAPEDAVPGDYICPVRIYTLPVTLDTNDIYVKVGTLDIDKSRSAQLQVKITG